MSAIFSKGKAGIVAEIKIFASLMSTMKHLANKMLS